MSALIILIAILPIALYFWREHKMATPSLQWPVLARVIGLSYESNPPRMTGAWNGRKVAIEIAPAGVRLTAKLGAATRLRVECAPKEIVAARAGILIPDPVEPIERSFRDRLLARCSDKAAGPVIFDAALQHRLAELPQVDLVGAGDAVIWTAPAAKDPDAVEAILGALCAVADGLESFPQGGAPRA